MDIAIIGAGPAGLAAGDALQQAGHRVVVFDKGPIAGNIAKYPPYMTWFSTRELLELGGVPMTIPSDKPTKREYLAYLSSFTRTRYLDVRTYHQVQEVGGSCGAFELKGQTYNSQVFSHHAERVVLALGAYDFPRKLGVPGEDLPKVKHYYDEAHLYYGQDVLVIGGRNSAVEAALEIWRNGGRVTLSYRQTEFPASVKYWLAPDILNRIKSGAIQAYMPSRVKEIRPETVVLDCAGKELTVPNDFVLALTGYEPDTGFLRQLGVTYEEDTKRPSLNPETYESNIRGIYLVGVMQAGNISSEIFVENSRLHGEVLVRAFEAPD